MKGPPPGPNKHLISPSRGGVLYSPQMSRSVIQPEVIPLHEEALQLFSMADVVIRVLSLN